MAATSDSATCDAKRRYTNYLLYEKQLTPFIHENQLTQNVEDEMYFTDKDGGLIAIPKRELDIDLLLLVSGMQHDGESSTQSGNLPSTQTGQQVNHRHGESSTQSGNLSSTQTGQQVNHSSPVWTVSATKLLIDLYRKEKGRFEDSITKHHSIWKDISVSLNNQTGMNTQWEDCRRKWFRLTDTFKKRIDRTKKTGEGAPKPWEFHDLMESVYGDKACVEPKQENLVSVGKRNAPAADSLLPSFREISESDISLNEGNREVLATITPNDVNQNKSKKRKKTDEPPKWVENLLDRMDTERKAREEILAKQHAERMAATDASNKNFAKLTEILGKLADKL